MRIGLKLALVWFLMLAGPAGAADNPFAPVLVVNDRVITYYDIDQRIALLEALGATGDLRKLAIEQLTEDRLKVLAAEQAGIELPDGAVQTGLEEFAGQRGLTVDAVLEVLIVRGIDRQTMDDFVLAGLLWRELVTTKFRPRATPTEADIDRAIEQRSRTPREVFAVAEIALPFAERGERETVAFADQLYRDLSRGADFAAAARSLSRSASAEKGGTIPEMEADRMPPALLGQMLALRPGQVTRPIPIAGGLAILKLVAIRQKPPTPEDASDPALRDQLRQQLFIERITTFGQGYLQELVSDALIVRE